ncbi:carbohydrate ABC transporter permease [Mycetocola zhadangensis]|uniref:carbohydrate ABC transporter permease n=1 Tax=Mycetocola zhadangensis TaxID=1164595 RepID=UPI003A4D4AE5
MSHTLATAPTRADTSSSRGSKPSTRVPRKRPTVARRRNLIGWTFVAPFGVVFLALLILPLLYAFWLSLQTETLAQGNTFTWFENYARAFTDPLFLKGARFVVIFSLIVIPVQMLLSLVAALIIDSLTTRLARVSRVLIFIPYAVPVVIGALMWGFLYSPSFGPGSDIFGLFGLVAPNLLSPDGIFFGLINIVSWQWAGYYMIIIYSALQGIDPALYEAAKLDGANKLQIALRIKVPMVASSLVLILVFALIHTLQFFTEPHILKSIASGAIDASFTPNIYAYNLAFSYTQFNYASAISFALGIIVFIGSYIFLVSTRKRSGL